jgi:hypothetical protein
VKIKQMSLILTNKNLNSANKNETRTLKKIKEHPDTVIVLIRKPVTATRICGRKHQFAESIPTTTTNILDRIGGSKRTPPQSRQAPPTLKQRCKLTPVPPMENTPSH